jgi:RNA polymerase sigma-70 factor (ECF subfamily)
MRDEPPKPGHDARLARKLRRGDEGAIDEIYALYGNTTLRFLVHAIGDRAIAEDVLQQVFLEVWQRGESYDPRRASMLTWIMQIARSRAIDQMRKRVPEPVDPHGYAATELSGTHESSLDTLAAQWQMAHYLRQLPNEQAELLKMRFVDDMSQSEIAEATGVPLGTVKTRMVQGLRTLRDLLEADGLGDRDGQ